MHAAAVAGFAYVGRRFGYGFVLLVVVGFCSVFL
jgi:hypothetical protein